MDNISTIDDEEIKRFSAMADDWWNPNGVMKPLHQIGHIRLNYIREQICRHYNLSPYNLNILRGLSVIDIGCGGGLLSEPMARMGAMVTAIDASSRNIAIAKLHSEKSHLTIDYRNIAAEEITNEQFDVVMAMEIIEHVTDPALFVRAAAKLLKPGGLMFISTINRTMRAYALTIIAAEYILGWLPRGTHNYGKFITPQELATALIPTNLAIKDVSGVHFLPLVNRWILNKDTGVNYIATIA